MHTHSELATLLGVGEAQVKWMGHACKGSHAGERDGVHCSQGSAMGEVPEGFVEAARSWVSEEEELSRRK